MPTLRNEQGKDLMEYLNVQARGRPIVCSGDFNAEPIEPVYQTLTSCPHLRYVQIYLFTFQLFVYCLLHSAGPENLKKSRQKKLVKSNKSKKFFFVKLHF